MSAAGSAPNKPPGSALTLDLGVIHFVGIGGIGMSGIAEILHNLGHGVQGSDIAEGSNVLRLRTLGINVGIGHKEDNIGNAGVVVVSSAVKPDNPELVAARRNFVPVVRRAEMLGELMSLKTSIAVGGTHGKTTTTSLIAQLLEKAGLDPTVINGGIINAWGSNARLGASDWMVAEADESDGSFVKLHPTIAVVTNMDAEHLDHYGSFDKLRAAFLDFVKNVPFYGFVVLCIDDPEVQALIPEVSERRIVTYGRNPQADVRVTRSEPIDDGVVFNITLAKRRATAKGEITNLYLPMHGAHNVQNAVAAVAIALELDVAEEDIRAGLAEFGGVNRRFTKTGEVSGITVIDDYAHHPVEIAAVLNAARTANPKGQILAVVQPHRYTRLRDLFEDFCTCFNDADTVIVADVYAAGEEPIEGIHKAALVNGLRARGHRNVISLSNSSNLAALVVDNANSGDMVVCLGAGNITTWANGLPVEMTSLLWGRK
ncbi:MAG: UDP-N-acetylmuramate--L-alanine ligase [Pseudomonadota bacterium]|nr:UDP-N-acetylmuramate--L-alanine ligase [Pseudomonadota bacterium]